MKLKYIFVTGGVISSLGKGIASASIGALLKSYGYKVKIRKFDPYLNVDPGTMSPYQHGEVFVTDDGSETDLDLGHYERFTGNIASKFDNITSGKIYKELLRRERGGLYLGNTVQTIPHITSLIKEYMRANLSNDLDFLICEIGGTVGDIEAMPYLEAARQVGYELGHSKVLYIHLTLLPYVRCATELKTKPTQHSIKELRSLGIQPNLILCRAEMDIPEKILNKIALSCSVKSECVIPALDQSNIYNVPISYHNNGVDTQILHHFGINNRIHKIETWNLLQNKISNLQGVVNIAIVGKYNKLQDAYKSLVDAISHASIHQGVHLNLIWVSSDDLSNNCEIKLKMANAVIIPGGFGVRGIEGKIKAAQYARENNIPLLGICLGMQVMLIEFAMNVLNIEDACSQEFSENGTPIISSQQSSSIDSISSAPTMKLGGAICKINTKTKAEEIYGTNTIRERYRHRFSFNMKYRSLFESNAMKVSGTSKEDQYSMIDEASIIELTSHRWFVGVQFHPEFRSSPITSHPLFLSLIKEVQKK
ncbi:MAG: CTP synthase [Proteobacteria bacterium]|nr:CTP synthase [Pseudomonadota bacterium]